MAPKKDRDVFAKSSKRANQKKDEVDRMAEITATQIIPPSVLPNLVMADPIDPASDPASSSEKMVTFNFKVTEARRWKMKEYAARHRTTCVALLNQLIDSLSLE